MVNRFRFFSVALAVLATAHLAGAQCAPDCPVKGGKDAATDCYAEMASSVISLNYPGFNPAKPKPAKEVRCFDGDPGCDLDGVANNSCEFDLDLCLRNADPSLPSCTPADVTAVAISGSTSKYPELAAVQLAVDALLPATTNVCTSGQSVTVPLKGPNSDGVYKAGKFSYKFTATAGGDDKNQVKLVCIPRGWPAHGFDGANTRATPLETKINAGNVGTLTEKWRFTMGGGSSGRAISSTVTVGEKLVYTSGWDGKVYALDKKKGSVKWEFNTGSILTNGVQSSVIITADGRVVVADSSGALYCLDGKKGTLLWQADAGSNDPAGSHAWASPNIINDRVFLGLASHNDSPCIRGVLVAFDLNTGAEVWRNYTVPERICYDDTAVECGANTDCAAPGSPCLIGNCDSKPDKPCATNADCPAIFLDPGVCVTGGECWLERSISCTTSTDCPSCVPGLGGGVTATAGASADGADLYMASVGCLSYPSIGNSDAIFKLDPATGAVDWVYRTNAPEQFTTFPNGPTYQDYGFLNGPILADVSDGGSGTVPVAVAGSKAGAIYAVNQDTGLLEWSNQLVAPPSFAAFGLFNGALAYDAETDQFFAALYDVTGYGGASPHLLSFEGETGNVGWSDQIGVSWSSLTVASDLVFAGTQGASEFYAYDKTLGTRLYTLTLPNGSVMGGAAVENGVVYVPFGQVFGGGNPKGGIIALELPTP